MNPEELMNTSLVLNIILIIIIIIMVVKISSLNTVAKDIRMLLFEMYNKNNNEEEVAKTKMLISQNFYLADRDARELRTKREKEANAKAYNEKKAKEKKSKNL